MSCSHYQFSLVAQSCPTLCDLYPQPNLGETCCTWMLIGRVLETILNSQPVYYQNSVRSTISIEKTYRQRVLFQFVHLILLTAAHYFIFQSLAFLLWKRRLLRRNIVLLEYVQINSLKGKEEENNFVLELSSSDKFSQQKYFDSIKF